MSEDSINDFLILYATVRRIDNDPDRPATVTTRQRPQTSISMEETRFRR
jgi:hypothetical protein